jgi:protein gp37
MERQYRRDGSVRFREDKLKLPFSVRKPTLWAAWNDLFHRRVIALELRAAFIVMRSANWHRFVVLTKRIERLAKCDSSMFADNIIAATTVENQHWADVRIPQLLACPTSVRMLSVEPLLGPIQLRCPGCHCCWSSSDGVLRDGSVCMNEFDIDWVIVGPETGAKHRPCKLEWQESINEQCRNAGVPCFNKAVSVDGKLVKDMADPRWPSWAKREFPEGIEVT